MLHHALPQRPDLFHIRAHDRIARFRNPLDVIQRADRLYSQVDEINVQFVRNGQQVLEMAPEFFVRAMDGLTLFAGEFELSARFKRDIGSLALEGDDATGFFLGLPFQGVGQAAQDMLNAAPPGVARCPATPA